MKPSVTLAQTTTSDGATLSLRMHDGHYHMRIGGHGLMSTTATSSEARLAELACEKLVKQGRKHVLIGGLGFGFTLRRVLELVTTDVKVEVAELLPQVVAWNREHLQSVNGGLVDDPRVRDPHRGRLRAPRARDRGAIRRRPPRCRQRPRRAG